MKSIDKHGRVLLTLMTGCPEFKYWLKDNDKLTLKDGMVPSWVATINALEALITSIETHYPEIGTSSPNEDVDPQGL